MKNYIHMKSSRLVMEQGFYVLKKHYNDENLIVNKDWR